MAGQTLSNGQIIPDQPALVTAKPQLVEGGILNAAAGKTVAANEHQAAVAKAMGAGQKGAGKRRKARRGGATSLNAPTSLLPTAGSIPGTDPTNTHIGIIDNLNALKAASAGDKLANAAPYYPAKSGGKRTKRKSKHGRRHTRSNRRGHHKSTRRHSRRHRTL